MEDGHLDAEEVQAIRDWLKFDTHWRENLCPFAELSDCSGVETGWFGQHICHRMFPRAKGCSIAVLTCSTCPCTVYTAAYVRRKARIIVARNGRFKRDPKRWRKND